MLIVDEVPESSCAACEHDSKIRIFALLIRNMALHYDDIDTHVFIEMLGQVNRAARDDGAP